MFEPESEDNKKEQPKSPLPALRWIIYLTLAGMLLISISYKRNSPGLPQKTFSGVELAIRPELAKEASPDELAASAAEAMNQGRHAEALFFLEELNKRQPGSPEILHKIGLTKIQAGDFPGAEESFLNAIAIAENPAVRVSLGELYMRHLNRTKDAEKQLQNVLDNPASSAELKKKAEKLLEKQ